ncbi:hypothetical protein ACP70R_043712 [Stipagrostis hirtigluma subsp. patula]
MATEVSIQANVQTEVEDDFQIVEDEDLPGMTEAERAAEVERLRQEALEEARKLEQSAQDAEEPEVAARHALWLRGRARIIDFDPKQRGFYYSRLYFVDHVTFDHDEESPLGPMRFTESASMLGHRQDDPFVGLNIFTVKISSSDVGFPIHVYGTVVARDSIDKKCVYLFRRDRDHCQLINSENEPLILTGPKRGLLLLNDDYVEFDLKIKDHGGQDRDFSKGYLTIKGVASRSFGKCEVESKSLATRLSTVNVMYAAVENAIEATVAIEVVQGDFDGKITAYTTSCDNSLVLFDSKVARDMSSDATGIRAIQLMRSVICVDEEDKLIIVAENSDGKSRNTEIAPSFDGGAQTSITVGGTELRVKVTWSLMNLLV